MKKYFVIFLLMVKCVFATEVPSEVKNAITEALNGKWIFQSFDNAKNKKGMGFDSTTKLSDVKAGDPFQIYAMSQNKFENSDESTPVCSLLTPEDWMVPLYVNGELMKPVMLIGTHFGEKEKWSAGIRAAKGLVQAWNKIKEAWPERLGYHPKFVLIQYPLEHKACFCVPEKGENNLTVIGDYYLTFSLLQGVSFTDLTPSRETLRSLRAVYKEQERKSDSAWKLQEKIGDSLVKIQEKKTEPLWKEREMRDNVFDSGKGNSTPASAVTSWWMGRLMQADSAITPANFNGRKPEIIQSKEAKPNKGNSTMLNMNKGGIVIDSQIMRAALALRVSARPIDGLVTSDKDQWYVLYAEDGTGIIRIGATGPIQIDDAPYKPGQDWGLGGSHSDYDGPKSGADLVEISKTSITKMAIIWKVKTAYLKVHATSNGPVSYRISFVPELPENRIGDLSPGTAAHSYIMGIANENTSDLYRATRIHYTMNDAIELRKKFFGTKDQINSFWIHKRRDALEVNAEGKLHVQHMILSAEKSIAEGKHWAFVIICEQRDGLWLVVNASRDPDLSESQVADIVERDFRETLQKW